jgi:hypothetical protein
LDHQSRSGISAKKKARDRLIRLASTHPDWVLAYEDEVWWSRLAQPHLHTWTPDQPLRLLEKEAGKKDPDPKAIACYGLLRADTEQIWLRFVTGRPVSGVTTQFLFRACARLQQEGKKALLLVWDNASWHISREVRHWIRTHNQAARRDGGVRILVCQLPSKSPWLNRIEAHWGHGKKAVVEPERKLTATELVVRVHDYYRCEQAPFLSQQVT